MKQKQRKLVTLNERLLKDMFFIIPLVGVIIYLNIIQPYMEWKFKIIHSSQSVDTVSILLLITQALLMFLSTDSLKQVKIAYNNLLTQSDKPVKILHDFRIEFQSIAASVLYFTGFLRFALLIKEYQARDYNRVLLILAVLVCLIMSNSIVGKRREIDTLIQKNKDRFFD